MRTTSFWLFILAFAVFASGGARAQENPTQQEIDQINGQIQTILATQGQLTKRIDALEKEVNDLRDKLNQPAPDAASADDLKKLATQVQELAKKQQNDNDLIVKQLEKLSKSGSVATSSHRPPDVSTPATGGPQNGYYYEIRKDDTLIAIAKAYSAELKAKVTVEQILAANPGLDPKNMSVGKKIFIPNPNAK
jgi:LysM repeat protein